MTSVIFWTAYVTWVIYSQFIRSGGKSIRFTIETVSYLLVVTALTASACAYLVARLGAFNRWRTHQRVPRFDLEDYFAESSPSVTVLVPSYREDEQVIEGTLLSAALQEFPRLRVVLLIDDPPDPSDAGHAEKLEIARGLPERLRRLLAEPAEDANDALAAFEDGLAEDGRTQPADMEAVAAAYDRAAGWLRTTAQHRPVRDHSDEFIAEHVLGRLAVDLETVAAALRAALADGEVLEAERVRRFHQRLVSTFSAELSSFERKSFASLSHEPNKAMNLNSYLSLMGADYRIDHTAAGRVLHPCAPEEADLSVPASEYVLTLDADSVILPEYCLRLVYLMEQPEHADVAVAQTPYSAYPGSATRLERLAGATTDLQHISHQGMGHYDAGFWVGANAVLRRRALEDLEVETIEDGLVVHRYISDRTVIEDTESSLDLRLHGWSIHHYPERLSYSATPPDFGALCIQRERWANGGLLAVPKLRRLLGTHRHRTGRSQFGEGYLRANYLASIAWSSIGLLFLLFYPFPEELLSPLVIGTAAPYFLAMAADLRSCGYKRTDIFRIYGFNLVLAPVNLSGVLRSVGQALTGRKIAFARTPKVRNRTTARLLFVVMPYLLVAWSAWTLYHDIRRERWAHALFAGGNAILACYAILAFIGLKNSLVDIGVNLVDKLYKPERQPKVRVPRSAPVPQPVGVAAADTAVEPAALDWAAVFHYGTTHATGEPEPIPVAAASASARRRKQRQLQRLAVGGNGNGHNGHGNGNGNGNGKGVTVAGGQSPEALGTILAGYLHAVGKGQGVHIRVDGPSIILTPHDEVVIDLTAQPAT